MQRTRGESARLAPTYAYGAGGDTSRAAEDDSSGGLERRGGGSQRRRPGRQHRHRRGRMDLGEEHWSRARLAGWRAALTASHRTDTGRYCTPLYYAMRLSLSLKIPFRD